MDKLKACPFCGGKAKHYPEQDNMVSCANDGGHCLIGTAIWYCDETWNTRPLEDALIAENARLRKVIQGMSPLWLAAMSYAEHGRAADLDRIRNYYNGRDNPMTSDEIHLMFTLMPDGGKNGR